MGCRWWLLSGLLESGPLVWVGRLSYALYLFHAPIQVWIWQKGLGWGFTAEALLILGLSFLAATLSHHLVEKPFLRLKTRFRGSDRQATIPSQTETVRQAA
jgi:peptidoglycan/LPS O-acetylase OafA/YrhL